MKSNRARSERKESNDRADTTGSRPSWAANVYAIVGPDGAGKTTIARAIMDRLARRGGKTWIAWMRSPRIVTLGVLGTASREELIRRKPILSLDPRLARRLRLYMWLAERFGLGQVDSGTTSESESASQVSEYLGIAPE